MNLVIRALRSLNARFFCARELFVNMYAYGNYGNKLVVNESEFMGFNSVHNAFD